MQIIKRGTIGKYTWYFRLGKRVTVEGINSQVGNGESVLFWEFDNVPFMDVREELKGEQYALDLPPIYILRSSNNESWHAVCMERKPWLEALSIVAGTKYVDPDYVRLAAQREHFTLRLSDKGHGKPELKEVLGSPFLETASLADFVQGVRYGAWVREK